MAPLALIPGQHQLDGGGLRGEVWCVLVSRPWTPVGGRFAGKEV